MDRVSRASSTRSKLNVSGNGQRIPPYGDAWKRDTYDFGFPQVYAGGRYNEGIPDVTFSGTGAPVQLTGPSQSLLSPTTDITVQDTLTWVRNQHTLRSGVLVTRNRKDQNGRFAYTGAVNFNPAGNPNSTGLAFADGLLGNFRTYSEGADDPVGFFRFTQVRRIRLGQLAGAAESLARDGPALRVPAAHLHAGQQHLELRPGAVRPEHRDPPQSQWDDHPQLRQPL